jgi:translation initiation factor 3 subunit E
MMAPEDAELWIVNLIRGAQLDAKIDAAQGCVLMGSNFPSVYQQVVDKTKDLTARAHQLATQLDRASDAELLKATHAAKTAAAGGGSADDRD